ncbi:MAG: serine hydrolase domain-containing protein, partial [Myxococcota bacterium]
MERAARELEAAVHSVPGASLAVRVGGRVALEVAAGVAELGGEEVHPALPFDLASLTKPLAAGTVLGGWVDSGAAHLDDPVSRWVPEAHPELTVAHLLGHTGGYPPWAPVHQPHAPRDTIVDRAIRSADAAPGGPPRYSDLGFLTLLRVIERLGGA